jgi:hypothetical protein
MNTMNLPGFTAECSMYSSRGQFQTAVSDTSYLSGAEVNPQMIFCGRNKDGDFVCTDPLCRFRCRSKKGAALQECLANCD